MDYIIQFDSRVTVWLKKTLNVTIYIIPKWMTDKDLMVKWNYINVNENVWIFM